MKYLTFILGLILAISAQKVEADTAVLSWTPPTQNCDGTPVGVLTGYKVYWGTVGRAGAVLPVLSTGSCSDPSQVAPSNVKVPIAYNQPIITIANPAQLTTAVVIGQPNTRYYFAVTAYNVTGESNLTNELSKLTAAAVTVPIFGTPVCPLCTSFTGLVLSAITGTPFTISWNVLTVQSVVSMYEYPPKAGAVPVFSGTFAIGVSSYNWIPSRAGVYYSRVCGTTCVDSYNNSFLFHVKLAPPGGGGVD
jgi:hypothetical protein